MEEKFPKRKTMRWDKRDYSAEGAYFITICTKDRKNLFWKPDFDLQNYDFVVGANCVRPQNLPLSKLGETIFSELERWNDIYPNVWIDYFVVMPNHIHLIVVISEREDGRTQFAPTVSRMVKQFKGKTTKTIGKPIFQKSFYDRVIRDREEYVKICNYILENPLKWEEDELYFDE